MGEEDPPRAQGHLLLCISPGEGLTYANHDSGDSDRGCHCESLPCKAIALEQSQTLFYESSWYFIILTNAREVENYLFNIPPLRRY
jgi:hypothetical protein